MYKVIKKYWYILLIIVIVGVILWFLPRNSSPTSTNKIDSIQSEINNIITLKDSVDQRIDTITVIIENTNVQYEKDRNTIINNTPSEDYLFFLEYIRSNKSRLDSINNL